MPLQRLAPNAPIGCGDCAGLSGGDFGTGPLRVPAARFDRAARARVPGPPHPAVLRNRSRNMGPAMREGVCRLAARSSAGRAAAGTRGSTRVRGSRLCGLSVDRDGRIRRTVGHRGHHRDHREHNEKSSPAHGGRCGHPELLQCTSVRLRGRVPDRMRMCLIKSSEPFSPPECCQPVFWPGNPDEPLNLDAPNQLRGESIPLDAVNRFHCKKGRDWIVQGILVLVVCCLCVPKPSGGTR